MSFCPVTPCDVTCSSAEGAALGLLGQAGMVAVAVADLASPCGQGLGKDGRTALTTAGAGKIAPVSRLNSRDRPGKLGKDLIRQRRVRRNRAPVGPRQRQHQRAQRAALAADREPSPQLPLEQHPQPLARQRMERMSNRDEGFRNLTRRARPRSMR